MPSFKFSRSSTFCSRRNDANLNLITNEKKLRKRSNSCWHFYIPSDWPQMLLRESCCMVTSIVWSLGYSSEQDKPWHGKGPGNVEPFRVILTIWIFLIKFEQAQKETTQFPGSNVNIPRKKSILSPGWFWFYRNTFLYWKNWFDLKFPSKPHDSLWHFF